MSDVGVRTNAILEKAEQVFAGTEALVEVHAIRERLDGPLRVAIAGKVKAGKSTLLNALVGERLAPTDTGECTKIVTWYKDGVTYNVDLFPTGSDQPKQVKFNRDDDALEVDLGGYGPEDVDRLEVTWPTSSLRRITLIDTPGVDTLNAAAEKKTFDFLDPDDTDTPADAVLYLMKHIHSSDMSLLEAFHDDTASHPNAINAIAVLSRADEVGGGRIDAMASAKKISKRYGEEKRLRRLVQLVVPVAGLLAETATTLTETEFRQLQQLAERKSNEIGPYLLSADRFIEATPETPLTSIEREQLLGRFGLFGVRQSLALVRSGNVSTSSELAAGLKERSGIVKLHHILSTLFMGRSEVLKARSALWRLDRTCAAYPDHPGSAELSLELERIVSSAHPFRELSALASLRSGWIKGRDNDLEALEQVLGVNGTLPSQRLGLDESSSNEELRAAAAEQHQRWQRLAGNPMVSHDMQTVIDVAVRSLEGEMVRLSADRK